MASTPKRKRKRKRSRNLLLRTVIASLTRIDAFGAQVAVEVYKRGLDLAARKACVCDGQKSNWSVWEEHLKPLGFIPILDFLHLLTYLYSAAQACGGPAQRCWERYVKWLTWAWQGEREKLLVALNAACRDAGAICQRAGPSLPRRGGRKTRRLFARRPKACEFRACASRVHQ